jgi:hypothetical protein
MVYYWLMFIFKASTYVLKIISLFFFSNFPPIVIIHNIQWWFSENNEISLSFFFSYCAFTQQDMQTISVILLLVLSCIYSQKYFQIHLDFYSYRKWLLRINHYHFQLMIYLNMKNRNHQFIQQLYPDLINFHH